MNLLSDQVDELEIRIILRELQSVVSRNVIGDVVEFGCYVGTTSVFIARVLKDTNRRFFVYDSFMGLPEKTAQDTSPLGLAFKSGELLASKKAFIQNIKTANVPMPIVKKAWFCDLSRDDVPQRIAFAFLDGDYYQSIADSFRLIEPVLVKSAVIIVDDYANQALPGASKATNEWLARNRHAKLRVEHSLAIITI
jgi:O-methyltransferase